MPSPLYGSPAVVNGAVVHTQVCVHPSALASRDMMSNNRDMPAERFYATDGPMATKVFPCDARYYRECLTADRGAVTVWLASGDVEHVAGTWYLHVERVRGEENEGVVEIIYLGRVLRSYPAGTWTRWEEVEGADPFTF